MNQQVPCSPNVRLFVKQDGHVVLLHLRVLLSSNTPWEVCLVDGPHTNARQRRYTMQAAATKTRMKIPDIQEHEPNNSCSAFFDSLLGRQPTGTAMHVQAYTTTLVWRSTHGHTRTPYIMLIPHPLSSAIIFIILRPPRRACPSIQPKPELY